MRQAGSFIPMLGAFFYLYPFFTGDTAVYPKSGFEGYLPAERPMYQGFSLRFTSLGFSLWLSTWAQCFILSYMLFNLA